MKSYVASNEAIWSGRIDSLDDAESFRIHQVVRLIDLREVDGKIFDYAKLNFCIIGFCSDEGILRNKGRVGASEGPKYIRKELSNLPARFYQQANIYDAGDVFCLAQNLELAQKKLAEMVEKIIDLKLIPIVLGGGHDVAFGNFLGISDHLNKQKSKQQLGIINFDAHFDLRSYDDGASSGSMFLQIADKCKAEKQQFSYMCIGIQKSGNTVRLFKTADALNTEYILAKNIVKPKYGVIKKKIQKFISTKDHIYMTICSDVFNAAYAPGVSALQPFGMNPEVALKFIKEVVKSKKVISLDIAEVSPRFDNDNRTAKLAALIIFAIINTYVKS